MGSKRDGVDRPVPWARHGLRHGDRGVRTAERGLEQKLRLDPEADETPRQGLQSTDTADGVPFDVQLVEARPRRQPRVKKPWKIEAEYPWSRGKWNTRGRYETREVAERALDGFLRKEGDGAYRACYRLVEPAA